MHNKVFRVGHLICNSRKMKDFIFCGTILLILPFIHGHGMVMDPVNRASRWRFNSSAPANYDDNGLNCGGVGAQWQQNDGKCGMCGDNYAYAQPRAHEMGGHYGEGVSVKAYSSGDEVTITTLITANHLGYFEFRLCNMDEYKQETEECFDDILLAQPNGETKHYISRDLGNHYTTLVIPSKVRCNHCVLQWTYNTGNSWGKCQGGLGCGPQETFRTCSDISIY